MYKFIDKMPNGNGLQASLVELPLFGTYWVKDVYNFWLACTEYSPCSDLRTLGLTYITPKSS